MPARKLRAIIFDIGRVIIRLDVARAIDGLASGLTLTPAEVWSAIEKDPRWADWQEGRMLPRDWYLHLSKRLGSRLKFEEFSEVWNRALIPEPMQETALFERLAKKYRLALLSNTDPIHLAYMEPRYDFFRHFPVRIYSCNIGASKPNPLVYREALRGMRAQANEAIYIDDIPAYVEAAERLGMQGIPYQSTEQLLADLRNLGVAC